MAGELQLPFKLMMGNSRPQEIAMGLGDAPIGKPRGRERHGEKQSSGDEELSLVTHGRSQSRPGRQNQESSIISGARPVEAIHPPG